MPKFQGENGEQYTWVDIRKAHPRLVYWVIFPQGIKEMREGWTSYYNLMVARTLKKAWRLLNKYNGAEIQRMVQCDLGRWAIKYIGRAEDIHSTEIENWDKYAKLPEIQIGKEICND